MVLTIQTVLTVNTVNTVQIVITVNTDWNLWYPAYGINGTNSINGFIHCSLFGNDLNRGSAKKFLSHLCNWKCCSFFLLIALIVVDIGSLSN